MVKVYFSEGKFAVEFKSALYMRVWAMGEMLNNKMCIIFRKMLHILDHPVFWDYQTPVIYFFSIRSGLTLSSAWISVVCFCFSI